MIDYDRLMRLKREGERFSYGDRETMLYAVSIGMGRDPLDESELAYVNEASTPRTMPSLATVLTRIPLLRDSGIDFNKVVHGEQRLALHRPLPPQGELVADARVVAAYDKGPGRGAVIYTEADVRSAADGEPLYTLGSTTFARGDGGFGGPSGSGPAPHPLPARLPDMTETFRTRKDQALLYRLNGDRNPLHSDPAFAKRAGFPVPILHGLCTYGIACRAVLKRAAGYDHTRISAFDVRFSSPVYPGESIATDLWLDGNTVSFRCRIPERSDVVVINHGRCALS